MALRRALERIVHRQLAIQGNEALISPFGPSSSTSTEPLLLTEAERRTLFVQGLVLLSLLLLPFLRWILKRDRQPITKSAAVESNRDLKAGHVFQQNAARVHSMFVYPIKGCAPVRLHNAKLTYKGFEMDRRWCFVRVSDGKKMNLKVDSKLAHIQPSFIGDNEVQLSLSPYAQERFNLPNYPIISIDARPSKEMMADWERVDNIDMYGDKVCGRVVPFSQNYLGAQNVSQSQHSASPSEWASKYLGYPVKLVHFDVHAEQERQRPAWPWYKPRAALASASRSTGDTRHTNGEKGSPEDQWALAESKGAYVDKEGPGKGVEFQDEYPLLVASLESLEAVQRQLEDALNALEDTTPSDGRGGAPFVGLEKVAELHRRPAGSSSTTQQEEETRRQLMTRVPSERGWERQPGDPLSILRFRPNIVVAGIGADFLPAFSEDSWESIWIKRPSSPSSAGEKKSEKEGGARIDLVTRCERCIMTTVDPVTGIFDAASMPLRLVARSHAKDKKLKDRKGACFGMYGVPIEEQEKDAAEQTIAAGDLVDVRWRPFALDDEDGRRDR